MSRLQRSHRVTLRRASRARALALLVALACSLAFGLQPTPTRAAESCTVTTLADSGNGSLRAALADTDCAAIIFQSGLTGTITLQSLLPTITRDLALQGPGAANLAISGGGTTNLLRISGGAVAIAGLTLRDGVINGGGLYVDGGAAVTVADVVISGNHFNGGSGGGIDVYNSTLTLLNSTISGNNARDGGGIMLTQSAATIRNSVIRENTAFGIGGGLALDRSTATLTNSTVDANQVTGLGGGIYLNRQSALTLLRSSVSGNTALGGSPETPGDGAGIYLYGGLEGGTLTLIDSTIGNNSTQYGGGGGVSISSARATILGTTISDNVAGRGGGIEAQNAQISLTSSTISGNRASGAGGGLNFYKTPVTVRSTTVTGNIADFHGYYSGNYGGGIESAESLDTPPVVVQGSIVAGNRQGSGVASDCHGPLTSNGGNLWGAQVDCPNNASAGDANLATLGKTIGQTLNATLADNGGATQTHALVANSPAVDRVPGGANCPATDQRGHPRPQGASCDSGAVESGAAPAAICASFADVPATDPICPAIADLAGLGILQGYATIPPTFGPAATVQRAQVSAFLVRALHWYAEPFGPRNFTDFDALVGELRTSSRILANACNPDGCVAQGYGGGRFGPNDPVTRAQVISLITRAFEQDEAHAWQAQPGGTQPYSGVPAVHDTDIRTFARYAGSIPDAPTTSEGWNAPASRAWVARVLALALEERP